MLAAGRAPSYDLGDGIGDKTDETVVYVMPKREPTVVSGIAGCRRRVPDDELDALVGALAAIAIEGPKGSARRMPRRHEPTRAAVGRSAVFAIAEAEPGGLLDGAPPVLLDEWQRLPAVWDLVRRSVDDGAAPGRQ